MTDDPPAVLTDREREILDGGLPPHLLRLDTDNRPPCDHCANDARYTLVLGKAPDSRGQAKKTVCDACLERHYAQLDLPLAARLTDHDPDES